MGKDLITAKEAARKTIKQKLINEISLINDAIEKAILERKKSCSLQLSDGAVIILRDAGYDVKDCAEPFKYKISWRTIVNSILDNEEELQKIIEEVKVQ